MTRKTKKAARKAPAPAQAGSDPAINPLPASTAQANAGSAAVTDETARQEKARNGAAEAEAERDNSELADAVRHAADEFGRNVPHGALSSGAWEAGPDSRMPKYPAITDGRYRIRGRDWIFTFKKGVMVAAEKGGPNSDPSSYTEFSA